METHIGLCARRGVSLRFSPSLCIPPCTCTHSLKEINASLNTVTMGIRMSTYTFGGDTNIQPRGHHQHPDSLMCHSPLASVLDSCYHCLPSWVTRCPPASEGPPTSQCSLCTWPPALAPLSPEKLFPAAQRLRPSSGPGNPTNFSTLQWLQPELYQWGLNPSLGEGTPFQVCPSLGTLPQPSHML